MTISTLLMGNISPNRPAHRPATDSDPSQFSTTPVETPPMDRTPQKQTTDNSSAYTQCERTDKPTEDFRSTFRAKAGIKQADQPQESGSTDQGHSAAATAPPESPQGAQAAEKPTVNSNENNAKTLILSKNQGKLADFLASSQISKPHAVPVQVSKTVEVTTITNNGQALREAKGISPDAPRAVLAEKARPAQAQVNEKMQAAAKMVISTKGLTISQNPRELATTASDFGQQRADVGRLTAPKTSETAASKPGKPLPEAATAQNRPIGAAGELSKSDDLDKATGQKTESLKGDLPKADDTYTELPEKTATGASKPSSNLGKHTLSENATNQQNSGARDLLGKGKNHADSPAGDPLAGNLNRPHGRISGGSGNHAKNSGSSGGSNRDAAGIDQLISSNGVQTPVAERFAAISAQTARNGGPPTPERSSTGIGDQIHESIRTSFSGGSGEQQITVRLNPPELGRVFVRLQEEQDQITGMLEVSKAETRYQIEQALPQIVRNLQDSGIAVKRLEVSLTDQSEQNAFRDQSLHEGWSEQNHFHGGNDSSDAVPVGEGLTNSPIYTSTEPYEMLITERSINVLV